MKTRNHFLLTAVLLLVLPSSGNAQRLDVVTTLPDLAWIAEYLGGDHVEAFAIAAGYQDPHFVDPKPSYIVRLSRADVFVTIGLDLESGWVPSLLNSARNDAILRGGPGYVDASVNVPLLEVPASLSREQGDIHAYGNPHYWLDPGNAKIIARNIADGLISRLPGQADAIESNLARFGDELDSRIADWQARMQPYQGQKIVAYHNTWPYLEAFLGVDIVDFLEPKPGIPPTPSQLAKIIDLMSRDGIGVIIITPYYRPNSAQLVARETGAVILTLASSVGAFDEIDTYFDLFDYNVDQLIEAFQTDAP